MARFQVKGVNDERDTCECCGKTGLKKVVWIEDTETGEIKCFGSTCALQPVKGFDCVKEIKSAVAKASREAAEWQQRVWGWARMQYRKAGGKFGPDTRPLDGDLYASCLEGGKAAVEKMKKDLENFRASKLA